MCHQCENLKIGGFIRWAAAVSDTRLHLSGQLRLSSVDVSVFFFANHHDGARAQSAAAFDELNRPLNVIAGVSTLTFGSFQNERGFYKPLL